MRGVLLTGRPDLAVNGRLVAAAQERGLELRVLDGCRGVARRMPAPSVLDELGNAIEVPELVLPRVGNWRPMSLLGILEVFRSQGAWTPNSADAIRAARDHWRSVHLLIDAGLVTADTLAGGDPESLAAACDELGYPVVVKQRRSRQGIGVIVCRTADHLQAVLDSLWRVGDEVLVQRFIEEARETVRLLVAGDDVVAAARFRAARGEWRSNAARGASVEPFEPTKIEVEAALNAARAIDLKLCGVDLVSRGSRPLVLEVNPSPGIAHLERAGSFDVALALIDGVLASWAGHSRAT